MLTEARVKVFNKKKSMSIDKFSNTKPILSDITLKLTKEIKLVLDEYNKNLNIKVIKFIGNIQDIKNDLNSINFKIKFKNKNNLLLKKIPKFKHDISSIMKMTELMKWCKKYA